MNWRLSRQLKAWILRPSLNRREIEARWEAVGAFVANTIAREELRRTLGGIQDLERLLLRLEQAYGLEVDPRERLPELAATLVAGLGLRELARKLLDRVPVADWAVQSAVAYAGTRALGEAAIRRLEAAPRDHRSVTPPRLGGATRQPVS